MFNHVLFLNGGEHCKLCLECIRACPVQSPRLLLQLPLRDVWRSNLIATEMAPLMVVVGLMALLLAAAPRTGSGSLADHWWFTLGALAVVAAGLGLQRAFRPGTQTAGEDSASWAGRAVYAYAPVVAAALFAFHVLSLPWLGEVFLRIGGSDSDLLQVSLLHMTQATALCIGGLMTLWTLWRLCRQRFGPALVAPLAVWAPLSILAVAYLVGGLILLGRAPG
jgi:ferredoxin